MNMQPLTTFLLQFDAFRTQEARQALLFHAGLQDISPQISLNGSSNVFVPQLLQTLIAFGSLPNGQLALDALLDTFAYYIGVDRQAALRAIRADLSYHPVSAPHRAPLRQIPPTIGIITALPKEFASIYALLDNPQVDVVSGRGAGRQYEIGTVAARRGGTHNVVLALADMGNNSAAIRTNQLLQHYPSVTMILMVGIAGGIPHPKKPDEHVRLGDIVVSNMGGVVQYDFVKETAEAVVYRYPPRPPSALLLEAVRLLEAAEIAGRRPWLPLIEQAAQVLSITRPPEEQDILVSSAKRPRRIIHPLDTNRIIGQPRVFIGPIASANILQKNPMRRDELRKQFGVKAVEMEGSGIADAAWSQETGYLIVRGICDYCDSRKNDIWQPYATIVAAGYVRALIESLPTQGE
jgi:nucleoside phosphorylase